jgi:hypothetical protein
MDYPVVMSVVSDCIYLSHVENDMGKIGFYLPLKEVPSLLKFIAKYRRNDYRIIVEEMAETNMEFKGKKAPFKCYVDRNGYFTQEYKDWCVQRGNYPGSGLMIEDLGSDTPFKEKDGIVYVATYPFETSDDAKEHAKKIRDLGGLTRQIPCQRKKKIMFMVWFNPNGSHEAREYVGSWRHSWKIQLMI